VALAEQMPRVRELKEEVPLSRKAVALSRKEVAL